MPRRWAIARENNLFSQEVRQLIYGKGRNTYRILFTVLDDQPTPTVRILPIRNASQRAIGEANGEKPRSLLLSPCSLQPYPNQRATMDTRNYAQIVQTLLTEYAKGKPAYGDIEVETIFDKENGRYPIVHTGWHRVAL